MWVRTSWKYVCNGTRNQVKLSQTKFCFPCVSAKKVSLILPLSHEKSGGSTCAGPGFIFGQPDSSRMSFSFRVRFCYTYSTPIFSVCTKVGFFLDQRCCLVPEGSLIQSPLLLLRATVQIFPGKNVGSASLHSTVGQFLLEYHYLCTTTCVPLPLTVKKFPYKPFFKKHILRLTVLETALCRLAWSHRFKS